MWMCLFEMISEILEGRTFVSGAWYKSYSEQPTEIVNASAGPGKISCALDVSVFYGPFSQLSDIFDPCAHWYCDYLRRAWQSFLCRQWPVGYFCGPFSQLSATVLCCKKIVSWFENLWKEIRKELKQLFLLMLKFKVSQELDVHLSVLFYVAMSKRLEIES